MLVGEADSGKTTTLHLVLLKMGKVKSADNDSKISQLGVYAADFECTVTYKRKKIAFYTAGDVESSVKNAIENYERKGVDVLICAGRPNFEIVTTQAQSNSKNFIPVSKQKSSDESKQISEDEKVANEILNNI